MLTRPTTRSIFSSYEHVLENPKVTAHRNGQPPSATWYRLQPLARQSQKGTGFEPSYEREGSGWACLEVPFGLPRFVALRSATGLGLASWSSHGISWWNAAENGDKILLNGGRGRVTARSTMEFPTNGRPSHQNIASMNQNGKHGSQNTVSLRCAIGFRVATPVGCADLSDTCKVKVEIQ
jgi:hypothetical protein